MKIKHADTLGIHCFKNLKAGDTFYYNDKLYIKVHSLSVTFAYKKVIIANALSLEVFALAYIKDDEKVACVESELTVSNYRRMN
jgi:hypothetical protein